MAIRGTKAYAVPIVLVLILAGATAGWFVLGRSPASSGVTADTAVLPTARGEAPQFDIVRVGPQGRAIFAGRAEPGAEVVIRDGETEVARTRADSHGAFVALPADALQPGGRELTLASRQDGAAEVKADGTVLLVVPPAQGPGPVLQPPQAVAVLVPSAAPPRVLEESATGRHGLVAGLTLDRVDYDEAGAIRFTGGAAADGAVRVYIDNAAAGDARADHGGRWSVTPRAAVEAGLHNVRVDALAADGRVVGRVELPFERSILQAAQVAGDRIVVQPGQSLWRLARAAYGRGTKYTVIYVANQEQIRDPRLIYPGQTFSLPAGAQH